MAALASAPRHRTAAIRGMLTVSAATLGATLIVVATAGGTYGLWNDSAPINAGIVESGSLTLLVDSATLDSAGWGTMFPGDRVQRQVTLTNNGTVAADVTVATSSTSAVAVDYTVEILQGVCPAGSPALSATNSLTAAAAVGVWSAGQSLPACIEVTLKDAASGAGQGEGIPLEIVFTATQQVG